MRRRHLINLLLFLLACLLAVLAWQELRTDAKRAAQRALQPLTPLQAEDIRRVRIERADERLEFMRGDDGRWQMVTPARLPASAYRIDSILALSATDSLAQQPLDGLAPADYGLDVPRARVWLDDLQIDFGSTTPLDGRRYVRLGENLHIIPDVRYYQLVGPWTGYLDTALLPPGAAIRRLELPGLTIDGAEGRWQIEPTPAGWSADAVATLLGHWQQARAMDISPRDEIPDDVLDNAEIHIHLQDRAAPLRLVILPDPHELILLHPAQRLAYHLPSGQRDRLLQLPAPRDMETGHTPDAEDGASSPSADP